MSSIFLSHSHADKSFVDKIASDLRKGGYYVWTDDAEIKIGDSLIDKIREGINKVAYVGAVISKNSISSEWVKREIEIALTQEIEGKKVKVLPILLDNVDLPGFLLGKKFADFRDERLYDFSLNEIKRRLDETPSKKTVLSSKESERVVIKLKELEEKLKITTDQKEMLLRKLSMGTTTINKKLLHKIDEEKKYYPELEDINRNFAFMIEDMPVTAGYIIHAIRKQEIKGVPHQLFLFAELENKWIEISLLAQATMRRLQNISK